MNNNFENEINIKNLDEKNQELIEIIGFDSFIRLSKYYGGDRLYINRYEELLRVDKIKRIRAEYTGYNVKELARKYKLSPERIRQIIQGK